MLKHHILKYWLWLLAIGNLIGIQQISLQLAEFRDNLLQTLRQKEGLVASTLVKTDKGYSKIEDLKIGDTVLCYDPKTDQQASSKVTYVDKFHLTEHIQITINDQILHVAPEHKFWLQSSQTWITAEELAQHPELVQQVDPHFQQVQKVNQPLDVLRITVDKNHNFYITEHNILTHNFMVLEVLLTWGTAEGVKIAIAASPLFIAAAHQAFCWFTGKAVKSIQPNNQNLYQSLIEKSPQIYLQEIQKEPSKEKTSKSNPIHKPQEQPKQSGGAPQPNKDKEPENNGKEKLQEQINDVLKDTTPGDETKGRIKQFEKKGGFEQANKDFDSIEKTNIRDIKTGKVGDLSDGRNINVRTWSTAKGKPTLEIFNRVNKSSIKIRYS